MGVVVEQGTEAAAERRRVEHEVHLTQRLVEVAAVAAPQAFEEVGA